MAKERIKIDKLVHGGKGLGRGKGNRTIFVYGALPDETVEITLPNNLKEKKSITAYQFTILKPSPLRIAEACHHASLCGDCDFQHLSYKDQLRQKHAIILEQLTLVGKIENPTVNPVLPHPTQKQYRLETTLSPVKEGGGVGYWSYIERKVVKVKDCVMLVDPIRHILRMLDLELSDLRKLTIRADANDDIFLVFETQEAEPPIIELDLPVNVALKMPDGVAATLIGQPYMIQEVGEIPFRVSPGSFWYANEVGARQLVQTVLRMADLQGTETVVDAYCGVGMLTRFLADKAKTVFGIEKNLDSIEDAVANLQETENVALFADWAEHALPLIEEEIDLLVLDVGQKGIAQEVGEAIMAQYPKRIIYSNSALSTAAEDCGDLYAAGYRLQEMQPIDMAPQTHAIHTVSLWERPTVNPNISG